MTKYLTDSSVSTGVFAALGALAAWVHPEAAIGASSGAMFFLLSSEEQTTHKKLGYATVSLCVGYATGLTASEGWAMLTSAGSAAVAVVTLGSLTRAIEAGELANVLKLLIDFLRGRK